VGNKGFLGTGYDSYNGYSDFWEYTPDTCATEICNGIDDNCDGIVDNIIATITPSGTISFCPGGSVTLTANSGAGNYQWRKGNTNVSGATNQTYSFVKKAGAYSVKETGYSCNATSAATTLVVNPLPTATISYTTLDLCGQSSVLLTANSGNGYTYRWKKGNAILSGETNQTYSATVTATYKVIVTNSYGCSKTSAGAKVIKSCKESELTSVETTNMILYPNPAGNRTTIQFTLPQSSHVSIKVYDMSGREMKTMLNDNLDEGNHTLQLNLKDFPSGIYFVKMISDFGIETQKLMVQ